MTTRNMGAKHVPVPMFNVVKYPKTFREAIQSAEVGKWRDAMRSKIQYLKAHGT